MDFETVHIHKSSKSTINFLILLIPVIFVLAVIFLITLNSSSGKVSGVSTEANSLTNTSQK